MNMTQGSYLEFTVPMVVEENGYEMKINGQLFHLDATTSLAFRSLLECETFEVRCMDCFPRVMYIGSSEKDSYWNKLIFYDVFPKL